MAFASSLGKLLQVNSIVVKEESSWIEYYYRSVIPPQDNKTILFQFNQDNVLQVGSHAESAPRLQIILSIRVHEADRSHAHPRFPISPGITRALNLGGWQVGENCYRSPEVWPAVLVATCKGSLCGPGKVEINMCTWYMGLRPGAKKVLDVVGEGRVKIINMGGLNPVTHLSRPFSFPPTHIHTRLLMSTTQGLKTYKASSRSSESQISRMDLVHSLMPWIASWLRLALMRVAEIDELPHP